MKKTVRLTENDLTRLVKRVMKEQIIGTTPNPYEATNGSQDVASEREKCLDLAYPNKLANTSKLGAPMYTINGMAYTFYTGNGRYFVQSTGVKGSFSCSNGKVVLTPGKSEADEKKINDIDKCLTNTYGAASKMATSAKGGFQYNVRGIAHTFYANNRYLVQSTGTKGSFDCSSGRAILKPDVTSGGKGKPMATVQSRIQNVQSQLGIKGGTGKLDTATLQAMINKLSTTTPPATNNQQLAQLSQTVNTLNQAQA
ncbi:MAG: hypothetical protein WCJ72_20145 [Chryseobacterium sp.]